MRGLIWGLALALCASAAQAEVCAPKTLTRVVTREVTPQLPPAHFARLPKTLYRLGVGKARVEEAPDKVQGVHMLVVIDEPDVWFANREDGSGRHVVDKGPTFEVHMPIFAGAGLPRPIADIEFGCEAEFVRAHMPETEHGAGGQRLTAHVLRQGDYLLRVVLDPRGRPAEASLRKGGQILMSVAYDAFEARLPEDPKLFVPPEEVAFVEAGTTK